ncbi:MAG: hypothetical protein Q9217_000805 [Psora testacea]
MPSDIRSFFGGKGASSQEQSTPNKKSPETKPKGRGKRKVLYDSDDELEERPSKKTTPKKSAPKKPVKQESPVGEITTTSDYFAASGKSKPSRSTPVKPKAALEKNKVEATNGTHPRSTSKAKSASKAKKSTNGRRPLRKTSQPNYIEAHDEDESGAEDGLKQKIIENDNDSGEDVFEMDFKQRHRGGADEYASDNDDDDVFLQPTRKSAKGRHGSGSANQAQVNGDDDYDVQIQDMQMKNIPEYEKSKEGSSTKPSKGRKRKSAEMEGDKDDDVLARSGGAGASKAKSPAKTSTPKRKKTEEPQERSAVDDIFESIPSVRAPTPPPRDESKKFNWRAAQARPEPQASGAPAGLPTGAENCLAGLTFVFTGILDSLDRSAGQELVKRHGGKVTGAPSKKTSFVVLGTDAGPKKLETIKQHGLKTIDENGLFELVRKLPANGGDGKAAEQFEAKKRKEIEQVEKDARDMVRQEREEAKMAASARGNSKPVVKGDIEGSSATDSRLWTVKYAPTATSMICGNKGQVEKLQAWLRAWPSNLGTKFKKPGKDGFGAFRAICLHGPPGIGKTTAAHLAAKLENYDIVESNASDARSKSLVETGLKGVLDTTSLYGYFAGDGKQVESQKKKLVLIMDEVDGMSAGDRGGVGAMAATCRKTHVPIILICNDRKLPKMKPFDSVAFDLPFRRPTVDQVRQRIMTICFREKLKIPPNVINALIEGSHSDIRQIINMLSTAKLDQDALDFDQGKKMSRSWEKNIILKPWDIVSKILGGGMFAASSTSTLNDKIELYFNDHEFSSLMLQENYLGTRPMLANSYAGKEHNLKVLELTEQAAASISDGDLVDRMIHGSQQQWSLMPTHAVFSFVRPASFIAGSQTGNHTRFTSWLGNNSKMSKLIRVLKEIQGHMRLRSSGDRHEVRQQYFSFLWYRLVKQLQIEGKEAVPTIIDLMDSYFLTKDDWDAILELGVGPMDMEAIKIDTQAKSAFTRTYNHQAHPLPYMKASEVVVPKKKDKDRPDLEEALDESDSGASEGEDEATLDNDEPLDLKKDKYVKAPKNRGKAKTARRGKGKGKKEVSEDEMDHDEESEDFDKPKKGKGNAGRRKR